MPEPHAGPMRQRNRQRNTMCPRQTPCHTAAPLWLEVSLGETQRQQHAPARHRLVGPAVVCRRAHCWGTLPLAAPVK